MMANEDIRKVLTERLAALTARAAEIETELRQPLDPDFSEQAVDLEDDESLAALERSIMAESEEIRGALERLDAGVYGLCVECGEKIAPGRLAALPAAPRCIACASRGARA